MASAVSTAQFVLLEKSPSCSRTAVRNCEAVFKTLDAVHWLFRSGSVQDTRRLRRLCTGPVVLACRRPSHFLKL